MILSNCGVDLESPLSLHCHSPQSSPPRRGNLTPISLSPCLGSQWGQAGETSMEAGVQRGCLEIGKSFWGVERGWATWDPFFHQPPLPLPGQSSVALQVHSTCLTHQLGPCNFPFPEITLLYFTVGISFSYREFLLSLSAQDWLAPSEFFVRLLWPSDGGLPSSPKTLVGHGGWRIRMVWVCI